MTSSNLPASLDFQGTALSVVDHNGKPWLAAQDVARALGYAQTKKIHTLYEQHKEEFTDDMQGVTETVTPGGRQMMRIFSARGCHLIAMFARTANAAAFRRWVLDVLEGLAQPHETAPSLTTRRWLISYDPTGKEQVQAVPHDACVMSLPELLKAMNEPDGIQIETQLLADFIGAASQKLARRCAWHQGRAAALKGGKP